MNDEILEPAGIKCKHCGQYTHTFEQGRKCQDEEFLSTIVENGKLQTEIIALKKVDIDHNIVIEALKTEISNLTSRIEELQSTLKGLSERHEWQPTMGQCVCEWHNKSRTLITDWQDCTSTSLKPGKWRRVGNMIEIRRVNDER